MRLPSHFDGTNNKAASALVWRNKNNLGLFTYSCGEPSSNVGVRPYGTPVCNIWFTCVVVFPSRIKLTMPLSSLRVRKSNLNDPKRIYAKHPPYGRRRRSSKGDIIHQNAFCVTCATQNVYIVYEYTCRLGGSGDGFQVNYLWMRRGRISARPMAFCKRLSVFGARHITGRKIHI